MDGDGIPEVILELAPAAIERLLLHYENGTIYGYLFSARGMYGIAKDGSYGGSGGASHWGYYKPRFTMGIYKDEELCRVDDQLFRVNGKEVSEDLFWVFIDEQMQKEETTWYSFSEDTISTDFLVAWDKIN